MSCFTWDWLPSNTHWIIDVPVEHNLNGTLLGLASLCRFKSLQEISSNSPFPTSRSLCTVVASFPVRQAAAGVTDTAKPVVWQKPSTQTRVQISEDPYDLLPAFQWKDFQSWA